MSTPIHANEPAFSEEDVLSVEAKQYLIDFSSHLEERGIESPHREAFVGDVANLMAQGVPVDAFESPEEFAFKLAGFLSGEGGCGCGGGGCGGQGRSQEELSTAGCGCGGGGCGCGGH